jgi:hypothetical protein
MHLAPSVKPCSHEERPHLSRGNEQERVLREELLLYPAELASVSGLCGDIAHSFTVADCLKARMHNATVAWAKRVCIPCRLMPILETLSLGRN